jgi:hypothetical protein
MSESTGMPHDNGVEVKTATIKIEVPVEQLERIEASGMNIQTIVSAAFENYCQFLPSKTNKIKAGFAEYANSKNILIMEGRNEEN